MAIPTYVPLIVSLIALVVPILNLLRILFETADGYRKCSEAVIGPWSKLRWRRWSWSEFRFEVHFVTPKLELQDISEARLKEASYQRYFVTLGDRESGNQEAKTDDTNLTPGRNSKIQPWRRWRRKLAAQHWKFSNSAKRERALSESGNVLNRSLMGDSDEHERSTSTDTRGDVINSNLTPDTDNQGRSISTAPGDVEQAKMPLVAPEFNLDQRISWLSFLRHLHNVSTRSVPVLTSQPPPDLGPDPWASLLENPKGANLDLLKSRHPTGVSVSFVEWTWDSLPSKATRPMATTTLGTLVVMAIRLGMQWRIDLEKDSYQATGNGYSLSCTHVPEMGLVATFTAEKRDRRGSPHALSFNKPTDKFVCGIIPGAGFLTSEDFYCTDDSGHTDVLKVVLDAIDSSG
jgi:hypothetical protein